MERSAMHWTSGGRFAIAVGGIAAVAGLLSAQAPLWLIGALVLPLAAWLLRSPTLRFSAVLVGALAVFQSSDALSLGKLAYFSLFAACFVTSLVRVLPRLREDHWAPFRLLPWASALFGTYLVSTLYISTTSGTQPVDWLRDIVPYLLLSTMPIIALDAGMSMRHETAVRLTAIVGFLAVVGFTITFLTRRDFSTLPVARLLLASLTLCLVPFSYSLVRGLLGPNRIRWLQFCVSVVVLLLSTGTRTVAVFAVAILAVIGDPEKSRASVKQVIGVAAVIGAAGAVMLPLVTTVLVSDPGAALSRITGTLSLSTNQDRSYLQRQRAYDLARETWSQHPLVGIGPGHRFPTVSEFGTQGGGYYLDTPLLTPAKFGLLGTAAIAAYLIAMGWVILQVRRSSGYSLPNTVARASAWVFVALLPFGQFLEDKGFSLGLGLLLLLVITWHGQRSRSAWVPDHTHSPVVGHKTIAVPSPSTAAGSAAVGGLTH